MTQELKFCRECGAELNERAEICVKCGIRQSQKQNKNPGLAAVASFFFAGLGQIYNGEIGKGFLLMGVQVINVLLMFVVIGFITYPLVWAYGIWDAYRTAERLNL
jgi:TM2 domain-containing membrane protein YozV